MKRHAAFFGIIAHTSALLSVKAGVPFWFARPLAGLVTAAIGAILRAINTRLLDDSLAITTIGINFVVVSIFQYTQFFGSALGILGIRYPSVFGHILIKPEYSISVVLYILLRMWFDRRLVRSWLGLALRAVGQNKDRMRR